MTTDESKCPNDDCKQDSGETPQKAKSSVSRWVWIVTAVVLLGVLLLVLFGCLSGKTQTEQAAGTSEYVAVNLNVGDEFNLGKFEQDNDLTNGEEAITWQVLKVEDGWVLAISKYGLDMQRFNDTNEPVTWESCSLRKWLNGEFYENAFSDSEKAVIPEVTLSNPSNLQYGTDGGNDTTDKVFLLTQSEAVAYFSDETARRCYPTEYAIGKGVWRSDTGGSWWWLRTPGLDDTHFAFVNGVGYYQAKGWEVNYSDGVVRPAVCIKTN